MLRTGRFVIPRPPECHADIETIFKGTVEFNIIVSLPARSHFLISFP
jgi:hypothetical protein